MKYVKLIIITVVFALIVSFFQLIPAFFTEKYIFLTIFASFPIYALTKNDIRSGSLAFIIAGTVIFVYSPHESLMFVFTNGLIGLSLGFLDRYMKNKSVMLFLTCILLIAALLALNFLISVPVFGASLKTSFYQVLILFIICYVYLAIYYVISRIFAKRLKEIFELF